MRVQLQQKGTTMVPLNLNSYSVAVVVLVLGAVLFTVSGVMILCHRLILLGLFEIVLGGVCGVVACVFRRWSRS